MAQNNLTGNQNSNKKPNIIWVFGDQHRGQALSCAGDTNVQTPNVDSLAQFGLRFNCAVSGSPWCTPFRAALLTGQYPHQVGCEKTPSLLDPKHSTIAKPLKEAGYNTSYFGKWHLGKSNGDEHIPENQRGGFDYWMGFESGNYPYNVPIHGSAHEHHKNLEGYQTDAVTELCINHIQKQTKENPDQPFFSVLSVQPPHDRYVAPPEFMRHNPANLKLRPNVPDVDWVQDLARKELSGYYGMIENLDWNIGRVLDCLRQLKIDSNTWICFFSDHGDSHGSHGMFRKSNPYQESIHIPMLFARASPIKGDPSSTNNAVLNHVDIAPITLGMCGIDKPENMVGFDYSANIIKERTNENKEPDSAYLQQIHLKKFIQGIDTTWRGVITRDGWKYVCRPKSRWLMFNLNDDPFEQVNLAFNTKFLEKRKQLHELLTYWIKQTGDNFDMPNVTGDS